MGYFGLKVMGLQHVLAVFGSAILLAESATKVCNVVLDLFFFVFILFSFFFCFFFVFTCIS